MKYSYMYILYLQLYGCACHFSQYLHKTQVKLIKRNTYFYVTGDSVSREGGLYLRLEQRPSQCQLALLSFSSKFVTLSFVVSYYCSGFVYDVCLFLIIVCKYYSFVCVYFFGNINQSVIMPLFNNVCLTLITPSIIIAIAIYTYQVGRDSGGRLYLNETKNDSSVVISIKLYEINSYIIIILIGKQISPKTIVKDNYNQY